MRPLIRWFLPTLVLGLAAPIVAAVTIQPNTNVTSGHRHSTPLEVQQTGQPPLLPYIPKYYSHIKPILESKCVQCHRAGEIAPFSLEKPEDAVKYARAMQFEVQNKRMPPWMPGGSSPKMIGDLRLSDDEIAILANWAWAGAPLGKPSEAPVRSTVQRQLTKPDMSLSTGRDFATKPDVTDEWRCFAIDPKLEKPRFLTGFNIRAGNPKLVHHVGVFQITKLGLEQAKDLEAKSDGRGGYPCLGAAGVESRGIGLVGFWLPGSGAVQFPEGTGIQIRAGDGLVLQMHYNTNNGSGIDRTEADLWMLPAGVAPKQSMSLNAMIAQPEIPCAGLHPTDLTNPCNRDYAYEDNAAVKTLSFGDRGAQMSAGFRTGLFLDQCGRKISEYTSGSSGKNITATCENTLNFNPALEGRLEIRGALGHMHFLGSSFKLELLDGKTSQTLLEIPRWDFHWQNGYWFEKPIPIRSGQKMRLTCEYDNSPENQPILNGKQQAPRYVVWGERTTDEMCAAVFAISVKPEK